MATISKSPAAPACDLQRIVYASAASQAYAAPQLEQLVSKARERNGRAGISGMLIYHEQFFLQLIEGPGPALNSLFARLRADAGHHRIVLLLRERIVQRTFADSAMGFAQLTSADLAQMPGMADFVARRMTLQTLTPVRAVRLFNAFQDVAGFALAGAHAADGMTHW